MGEAEIQPVAAIIEREYNLIKPSDKLTSMSFGVPVKIGANGVEAVIEIPVDDVQDEIDRSAEAIKSDIQEARFNS